MLVFILKKTDPSSQYNFLSLIILGGDLGIVDKWHVTINLENMSMFQN